jgi:hypothetical protein
MGGTGISTESRSLFRPPEGGLTRDDNIRGSNRSVTLRTKRERNRGTENSCHRVRIKGNWDVGRFGRVIFFARINTAAPPAYARLTRPAVHLKQAYIYFIASVKPIGSST